jgi:hypothetical protein
VGLALVVLACGQAHGAGVVDPTADIQAQYETVLGVLKRPGTSGVVVTEVLPESPAGGANGGLRGGDIITQYAGVQITTLQSLREAVADAVARRIEEQDRSTIVIRARRPVAGGKVDDILISVPRLPLGIRAVEVQAGIAGPRNPPPSLRGQITLHWQEVMETIKADGGVIAMRVQERAPAMEPAQAATQPEEVAGEMWLGWQRYRVTFPVLDRMKATIEMAQIDPAEETVKVMEKASFGFELELGDHVKTPSFLLQNLQAEYAGAGTMRISTNATRVGETLRVETVKQAEGGAPGAAEKRSAPAPVATIVQPALPLVAAALPHEKDAVLGVQLLSVRDYIPRPGYVLAAAGKQALPSDGAGGEFGKGWRVDLMHFGVAVESYWYSDSCRLLCVQSNAGRAEVSRRVQNPADAVVPAERKAATRPNSAR